MHVPGALVTLPTSMPAAPAARGVAPLQRSVRKGTPMNSDDVGGPIPPPPRPVGHRDLDARGWWMLLLVGVLLVGLGIWMLTNLYDSVVVLAWIAGASLIVGGIVEVAAFGGRQRLGWAAWLGALLLVGPASWCWCGPTSPCGCWRCSPGRL